MEHQFIRFEAGELVAYTITANAGVETARFRKQILKRGKFLHPQDPSKVIDFDDEYFDNIIQAFTEGAVDSVPVITDDHKESYKNTVGKVADLEKSDKGLYAFMEVSDQDLIGKIKPQLKDGKGLVDEVSVSLASVIKDDGKQYPHTLMHVSIVPHAFYRGMDSFEQLAASVAESLKGQLEPKEKNQMGEKEVLEALGAVGINVDSLDALKGLMNKDDADTIRASVVKDIMAAVDPKKEANDSGEVIAAITGMKDSFMAELNKRDEKFNAILLQYEGEKAEAAVGKLIEEGKVAPSDKDHYVELYKTSETLFASITSSLKTQIDTTQKGSNGGDGDIDPNDMNASTIESELKRLKGIVKDQKTGE